MQEATSVAFQQIKIKGSDVQLPFSFFEDSQQKDFIFWLNSFPVFLFVLRFSDFLFYSPNHFFQVNIFK